MGTNKLPTAKYVAELAGVSQSTVSRVLSGRGIELIGEKTIQRVRKIATEVGYSPNPFARALRGKQTYLLGIIVREISDPFFASLIAELSLQAGALGYHVALGQAHSDPIEALQVVTLLDTRHMDGVIILGDQRDDESALVEMLKGHRAVVAMCRGASPESIPTINTDNRLGIELLLNHLTSLGHRKLAFIDGGWLGDIRERRDRFQEYVYSHALEIVPEWIQMEANNADGGYHAMQRLLDLNERPTAVLASDDVMAIGAIKAAIDAGLCVPQHLSITGFDDIETSRFLYPALTTVRQPVPELSREALKILIQNIETEVTLEKPSTLIRVGPELIVRQSTGSPPE